jgi:chemotaxis protein methyltransferase CheR
VLATDVSAKALAFARAGRYPADRLAALPEPWRRKYVQVGSDGAGTMSATIKSDVTFRRLNLLNEPWRFRREFDVIFCRNVLIYFDPPVKDQVVSGLVRWLAPGGTLYVGHAEALPARRWPITSQGPGIWRKNP